MAQTKLVYVIQGAVFDVALDIRKNSATFGQWFGMELNAKNKKMLLIPKGFAHGYCTLEDETEFLYKVDNFYAPEMEGGVFWNDPNVKISWPLANPIVSNKDKLLPELKNVTSPF
jgi:dTDP-4-dehydrorhamnose 3,5-epimerase